MTTTTSRDWSDVAAAAAELAGNWQRFDCFVWFRGHDLPDAADWTVWYTRSPQSGLLEVSSRKVTADRQGRFRECDGPDLVFEQHSSWVVGHMDGFSIRVLGPDGTTTDAFREFCRVTMRLDASTVLNEQDQATREYEATLENYRNEMCRQKDELPEGRQAEVKVICACHRRHRPTGVRGVPRRDRRARPRRGRG